MCSRGMLRLCYAYAEGYFFNGNGTEHESDDSRWNTNRIKYVGVHSDYAWGGGMLMLCLCYAYVEVYFSNGNGTDHESDDSRWITN